MHFSSASKEKAWLTPRHRCVLKTRPERKQTDTKGRILRDATSTGARKLAKHIVAPLLTKKKVFPFPCQRLAGKGHEVTAGVSKRSRSLPVGDAQGKTHGNVHLRPVHLTVCHYPAIKITPPHFSNTVMDRGWLLSTLGHHTGVSQLRQPTRPAPLRPTQPPTRTTLPSAGPMDKETSCPPHSPSPCPPPQPSF